MILHLWEFHCPIFIPVCPQLLKLVLFKLELRFDLLGQLKFNYFIQEEYCFQLLWYLFTVLDFNDLWFDALFQFVELRLKLELKLELKLKWIFEFKMFRYYLCSHQPLNLVKLFHFSVHHVLLIILFILFKFLTPVVLFK